MYMVRVSILTSVLFLCQVDHWVKVKLVGGRSWPTAISLCLVGSNFHT